MLAWASCMPPFLLGLLSSVLPPNPPTTPLPPHTQACLPASPPPPSGIIKIWPNETIHTFQWTFSYRIRGYKLSFFPSPVPPSPRRGPERGEKKASEWSGEGGAPRAKGRREGRCGAGASCASRSPHLPGCPDKQNGVNRKGGDGRVTKSCEKSLGTNGAPPSPRALP